MKKESKQNQSFHLNRGHNRQAPSNYNLHDAKLIFSEMNINEGDVFVDLGCGSGNYSIHASTIVGNTGKVFAVDVWKEMLNQLKNETSKLNLTNVVTLENDICKEITIEDNVADICFLSNVMHAHKISDRCPNLLSEIVRILKPNAQLAIIEFKKEKTTFGPPLSIRITAEDLEKGICSYGFKKTGYIDLDHNYMLMFSSNKK